ncbi:TLR adapter interacting with SLC15A4 on the lysosome [Callorhinchus milii]|nr:TLR adapter interacting with SLC15A4 on the lysosome [Callorhinchus milii]XP_007903592.1 TLR adapter interacting with SLC15A4 on the lysosome [Callorhinchus milii]|eukprot:gi/632974285/ref/XP_007903591.1/ PREDICTED: uncharacterized protein CXorf21 homolog [Callorhinchus milii]
MLSEGFLLAIPYWNESISNSRSEEGEQKRSNPPENNMMHEMSLISNLTPVPQSDMQNGAFSLLKKCKSFGRSFILGLQERKDNPSPQVLKTTPVERQTSHVVDIPGSSSATRETYLVPPCCKSICDNYNDLQIAGDQVMPISLETSGLTSKSSNEFYVAPFLYSSEIPLPTESPKSSVEFPHKPANSDTCCWRAGSGKDKSIIQHSLPLTNSVLNDYLEQKVMELYKQYMMDSMLNSASPTKIMASELIMSNVDQISMQISREQNMETTKAKDIVISYLLRLASEIQSSEISTPNLQISS